FAQTGFREPAAADDSLQAAAAQGIALLKDGKPEAAADVMSAAVVSASNNSDADRSLLAAVHLNLASAFIQSSDPRRGVKAAQTAQEFFRAGKDTIGIAQALHTQAVATLRAGDPAGADHLFADAAATLQQTPGVDGLSRPPGGVPGPV